MYLGNNGIICGVKSGILFIDFFIIDVDIVKWVGVDVYVCNMYFIDVFVFGGMVGVKVGMFIFIMGGSLYVVV